MNIRTRLTVQFTSIFVIILILFSLTVYFYTSLTRSHSFYESLMNRANVVAHVYLDANKVNAASYRRLLQKYYQTLPQEVVQVYNSENKVVFREGAGRFNVKLALINKVRKEKHLEWHADKRQFAGIVYYDTKGKYVVIASSVDVTTREKLEDLQLILISGLLGSLVIVVLSGWAFSRQALRPISKVVEEVEKISASDLHRRLSQADGKDEVSHLAHTFNNMLDRLERAFDMQNTFISNASHELRTPLTTMIGELEVALMKQRDVKEYQRVLQSILDEARLLARLSNGMLQIAHASFDIAKIKLTPLRFDEVVFQASEEAKKRQPTSRIDIQFQEMPDDESKLICKGNESLLLIAMLNIFENACKFSPGKPNVTGIITAGNHEVVLQVKDHGRGMTKSDLKNIYVPFWRSDNVRDISGHGIGLPLTQKIINLHNGTIKVESQLAIGTEVIISIPTVK